MKHPPSSATLRAHPKSTSPESFPKRFGRDTVPDLGRHVNPASRKSQQNKAFSQAQKFRPVSIAFDVAGSSG
jgi:hypothetical protein